MIQSQNDFDMLKTSICDYCICLKYVFILKKWNLYIRSIFEPFVIKLR